MKSIKALIMVFAFLVIAVSPVFAVTTIRIEPHAFDPPDPVMLSSPATFKISITEHTAYDPHILLVMTKACYEGLTGNILVTWTGGFTSFSVAEIKIADT